MSFIHQIMDNLRTRVPDGEETAFAQGEGRAYLFDRAGNVVSTPTREGEPEAELQFRLRAALLMLGVTENG